MNKKIKSLIQQAEVYKTQGLLEDAGKKLKLAAELIQNSDQIQNKEKLINGISKKMAALNRHTDLVQQAPTTPEMSEHVNTLIKKLFSFSQDSGKENKETAALEGAIALAKFGQFEAALKEFQKLIEYDTVRLPAAKNILRCYVTLDEMEEATEAIGDWKSKGIFTDQQIEKINKFFDELSSKKRKKKKATPSIAKEEKEEKAKEKPVKEEIEPEIASEPDNEPEIYEDKDEAEEEFLDISAVAITFDSGPHKGEQVELDVSFQSGNIISLIISSKDESLIENLKVGYRLDDVHFYSPIAIFRGSGVVSAMTQIKSGPKQGDYSLDIKIESI